MCDKPTVKHISPPTLHPPNGYSHIVSIEGQHKTIEIAGQIGMAPDGSVSENYEDQVKQAFLNLKQCLIASASPPPVITKLRYYIVNYEYPQSLEAVTAGKKLILNHGDPLPASVLVAVPALGHPRLLFEVEATAVVGGSTCLS